ncbi:ABC transporter ATP-binding protein [Natronospora cellulosivora (SeqCode)]
MFSLKNVKFKDILNILDLEIEEKKITCILGKSGGGKTTFLRLLNNIISADQGTIKFKNKDIEEYHPIELRREIIMLPQSPSMFPGTIEDNFSKTLEYTESKEIKQENKVKLYGELLKKVGLSHTLDTNTKNLSGGEKQRLALARILLLKPAILLLDEPSSALDEETEDFIIKMVVNYIKEKKGSLIMVTHSRSVAEKYANIIITLNNGKIEEIERKNNNE